VDAINAGLIGGSGSRHDSPEIGVAQATPVFLAGTESGSLKAGDFEVVGRLDSMRIAPVN